MRDDKRTPIINDLSSLMTEEQSFPAMSVQPCLRGQYPAIRQHQDLKADSLQMSPLDDDSTVNVEESDDKCSRLDWVRRPDTIRKAFDHWAEQFGDRGPELLEIGGPGQRRSWIAVLSCLLPSIPRTFYAR
ncbi:hypothetical protein ONS96_003962 [Cadophora gregata f. sp. sojae]|nr:hypothetical protein ONS96_003962 [Cadophora gregata f. sp. sojae]